MAILAFFTRLDLNLLITKRIPSSAALIMRLWNSGPRPLPSACPRPAFEGDVVESIDDFLLLQQFLVDFGLRKLRDFEFGV